MRDEPGLLGESTVPRGDLRQTWEACRCRSRALEKPSGERRYRGVPVRHDLRAVGRSVEGARLARDSLAATGPGAPEPQERPAPGPIAHRAALSGCDAGVEVSELSVLLCLL